METEIRETAANSPFTIDYEKALKTQQQSWTIKTLGIELQEETPFCKNDFEHDLKKVSRKASW